MDHVVPELLKRIVNFLWVGGLCLFCFACKLSVVSQPSNIESGMDVEFVLQINNASETIGHALLARVPSGWTVVSSTYENSTAPPESGSLDSVVSSGFFCFEDDVPIGYQGLAFFRTPSVPTIDGD